MKAHMSLCMRLFTCARSLIFSHGKQHSPRSPLSESSLPVATALAADASSDTLTKGHNIIDDDTSTEVPKKRYLGVWFSISEYAICWVANRDRPLADTSGVLVITDAQAVF